MKKKGIVAFILLAAIPFFVPIFAHAYVSPGKPTGFVNDFAQVLTAEEKANLEATLSQYEKKTGNEIVIATVPTLDNEAPEDYAIKLFAEWGIGKKDKDNGLLILHAPNERKIWIEVGYGLEPYIVDAKAASIYRNILTPAFKENRFGDGYKAAVKAIIDTIGGNEDAIPTDSGSSLPISFEHILTLIFFAFLWLVSILSRSKSWWLGGVLGALGGIAVGYFYGFFYIGVVAIPILALIGLIFDFIVSKTYSNSISRGGTPPWWIGGSGGFGGGSSGGFGGFGGGGSGGGGGGGGY